MLRSALVACVAGALAAGAAASGCGGEVVHLGNCPHAQVPASEVVWIGDSWVKMPGQQVTGVQSAAQKAGAIGPSDGYTDDSAPGATIADVEQQYITQEATTTKAKVLIMDGGTLDTIASGGSADSVSMVASKFNELLGMIAADGTVADIVYFLMPDLATIPGVPELRPLLQQECAASAVPCYFLDLGPLWSGHSDYTNTVAGVPFPSQTGAVAIAGAIWATMQEHCIAQ